MTLRRVRTISLRSPTRAARLRTLDRADAYFGNGLMGTELNGYLVLQGNIPLRSSQVKLARKRLGTRWAKYPFSRCRGRSPRELGGAGGREERSGT